MHLSKNWSHEGPSEEVTLVVDEGSMTREESTEEGELGEEMEEETLREAPVPKKKGHAGALWGSTRLLVGSMYRILNVTEHELVGF